MTDAAAPALTPKQQRFIEEYLIDACATKAAVRAGYSERTANRAGPRLLEHPDIRAAIDARMIRRSEKTEIHAERVLEEIAAMAFYDPAELIGIAREIAGGEECREGEGVVDINGKRYAVSGICSPAHIAGLPENVRRAIVGWGWDRNQNFTLKLADKSKALDQLARHLSLYNDRLEVSGVEALGDRIARAKIRAASASATSLAPPPASVAPAQEDAPAGPADPADATEETIADRLARARAANAAPAAPSSPPSPPPPPPPARPAHVPIMPAAEPVTWPSSFGNASTDYNPVDT